MYINNAEEKTTANRLAKETIIYSVELWLEHIFGTGLHTKDENGKDVFQWENLNDELMDDMFHWISITGDSLHSMTKREKKEFVLAMEKQIYRVIKFLGDK